MKLPRALLALYCAEGFLLVLWTFLTPSESGKAVLLWLSRERLVLLAVALALWVAVLALSVMLWRSPEFLETAQASLDRFCLEERHLGAFLLCLIVIPIIVIASVLAVALTPLEYAAYRSWAPNTFHLVHSLVLAFLPLLTLAILIAIESAAFLALRYRQHLRDRAIWAWSQITPALFLLLVGILTVLYWLVLIFQLRFFVNNPAWYWKFEPVPFHLGDLVFIFVALLLLGLAYWCLVSRRNILGGLITLFLLALFLQFGVGLMSGDGMAAFEDRYFSTYHKNYLTKATQGSVGLLESVRHYEQLFGSRAFTNTKPPGLMVFYLGLDHLINGNPSVYSVEARYERLASLVTYAFPLLAALGIIALYIFARRNTRGRIGLLPTLAPFLLVLCPNLILFSLFPDQAVYPLLFLLGAAFIVETVRRQSLVLAFALGLFLYCAAFFAFTMLPLYPFAYIYLALNYWINRRDQRLKQQVLLALGIAAGTLLLYFLFRYLLDYSFLSRFETTVAINHNYDFYLRVGLQPPTAPESLTTRLGQIVGAAWLNNLDFAAAMGFPIYALFAVQGPRLLKRVWKGCVDAGDLILAALLLSFIVLNLAGTAQGEVPRLWLFWLPMVVLLAALELETWVKAHPRLLLWLAVVQLVTLFLTFHFQDLRM